MISIHTLELTLETSSKEFNEFLSHAYKMAKKEKHRVGHSTRHTSTDVRVDDSLISYGITVEYHNCDFRKMIRFRVNPSEVLGGNDLKLWKPTDSNIDRLIRLLSIHIENYFDSDYGLNDLMLTRVEFTANLDVGKDNVSSYIELMHKIGKVKKFSKKYSNLDYATDRIEKEHSFDLEGKTNGIGFTVYDKEADLKKKGKDGKAKKAKGMLRVEVRLKKRKALEKVLESSDCKTKMSTEKELKLIARKSKDIFMGTFVSIVPYGDFYRLKDAEERVKASNLKKHQKDKMLRLLRLIPQKKSLYLAMKELAVRDANTVLTWFASINTSPVTISKRADVDFLENMYSYL